MPTRRVWRALFAVAVVLHFVSGRLLFGEWPKAALLTAMVVGFTAVLYLVIRTPPQDRHIKP